MQKSAKVIAKFDNVYVRGGEVFHKKDADTYWYSMDMEQSFLVPGLESTHEAYVHNFKIYYNANKSKFVELNVLTGETRELCDRIMNLYESKFEYPYMITPNTFMNVETGVILATRDIVKKVKTYDHGLVVVANIIGTTPDGNKNKVDYNVSLHNMSDFKVLYTGQPRNVKSTLYLNQNTNRSMALNDVIARVDATIIDKHTVCIDGELIKVREKTTEKPRCVVCHKKLTKCGVVLPCKHCAFHYECIGDIGSKCPQCDGHVADKINTA